MSWFKKLFNVSSVNKKTKSIPKKVEKNKSTQTQIFKQKASSESSQQDDTKAVSTSGLILDTDRERTFADVERHEKTFYATSTPRSIKAKITKLNKQLNSSGEYFDDEKAHFERRITQLENLLTDESKRKFDAGIRGIKLKEKQIEKEKKAIFKMLINNVGLRSLKQLKRITQR